MNTYTYIRIHIHTYIGIYVSIMLIWGWKDLTWRLSPLASVVSRNVTYFHKMLLVAMGVIVCRQRLVAYFLLPSYRCILLSEYTHYVYTYIFTSVCMFVCIHVFIAPVVFAGENFPQHNHTLMKVTVTPKPFHWNQLSQPYFGARQLFHQLCVECMKEWWVGEYIFSTSHPTCTHTRMYVFVYTHANAHAYVHIHTYVCFMWPYK